MRASLDGIRLLLVGAKLLVWSFKRPALSRILPHGTLYENTTFPLEPGRHLLEVRARGVRKVTTTRSTERVSPGF